MGCIHIEPPRAKCESFMGQTIESNYYDKSNQQIYRKNISGVKTYLTPTILTSGCTSFNSNPPNTNKNWKLVSSCKGHTLFEDKTASTVTNLETGKLITTYTINQIKNQLIQLVKTRNVNPLPKAGLTSVSRDVDSFDYTGKEINYKDKYKYGDPETDLGEQFKLLSLPDVNRTTPITAKYINDIEDYLTNNIYNNTTDTVETKTNITTNQIKNIFDEITKFSNDCICYSDCGAFSYCSCYGYCSNY